MFLRNPVPKRQDLKAPTMPQSERRSEERLRYFWPIWYSADGSLDIQQGRMVDLCSRGVSFLVPFGAEPKAGDEIWLRSSYPLVEGESFGMASFTTSGRVLRSGVAEGMRRRLAVQFAEPLEHRPAEVGREAAPALG